MSNVRYEQYKDALRRGHQALAAERLDAAAAAYRYASELAPDRALPLSSLGAVLGRLARHEESDVAYTAALLRDPQDEASLRGRARLRAGTGRRIDAAGDLETLAEVLERSGRVRDAHDVAREALELAESRARRRTVDRLGDRLRETEAGSDTTAAVEGESGAAEPAVGAGAGAYGPGHLDPEAMAAPALPSSVRRAAAEALLAAGRFDEARTAYLELAAADRTAGRHDAALDACLALLAVAPSDVAVQMEAAAIQIALGLKEVATEKLRLLERLADLGDDEDARLALRAFRQELGPRQPDADWGLAP